MSDEMEEIRNDFLVESQEMIELLDQRFIILETDPANTELLNEIFRAMHSMKGSAGFLGFTHLVDVTHRAESILNKLRQGDMTVTPQVITAILEAIDVVKLLMADIRESGTDAHVQTEDVSQKLDHVLAGEAEGAAAPTPAPLPTTAQTPPPAAAPTVAEAVAKPIPPASPTDHPPAQASTKLGEILVNDGAASKEQIIEALDQQDHRPPLGEILVQSQVISEQTLDAALQKQQVKGTRKGEEEQTIRVETRRLDSVMNLVGELVLGRNRMMKIGGGLDQSHENDPLVRELGETLAQLNLVTTDLQLAVMKTRMLPIRKVLSKFPRMVRDLSQKMGKQVRLELQGEETELDKSVADEIGDPLVHLVRNAIDHGLEPVADRQKAGKPTEGVVRISACQEGNSIVIRIEDDGRGLQVEKIKAKALANGVVSEAELAAMDPRQIMNLIFLPGFSTADQVTDVSGRGVGMDVVRTNIRRINGTVEVQSQLGKGSQITIKLPLTIAIIQALLVEVEKATFAIPLGSVVEAVKITRADIKTINGREVLNLRERVLPLLRLTDEFEIQPDAERDKFYVVVAGMGEKQVGVVVDRLRSQEEVVIKSMGDYLTNLKGIAGATITGEGKVVLILDIAELLQDIRMNHLAEVAA
ncbi:MAG: chemotaxis protein CheA [Nitrospirae bacterium]|nr:MAG: chemotaxis protein CheA [Nitrospirota bacterium]